MEERPGGAHAPRKEARNVNPARPGSRWQFWVDRGGTFTDVVAMDPEGRIHTRKLLSEDPARYGDAAIAGIRSLLGVADGAPLPADRIAAVKMGTTVATNALLERKGEPTLLVITRGFGDALRIGYQNRPELFTLDIRLPETLYSRVLEVRERVGAHGEVIEPLDAAGVEEGLSRAFADGFRSVAVVLMHGYRFPAHERRIAEIAKAVGFTQVSVSSTVAPLMKLVGRGDTTVVDAYLSPVLRRYVERVARELKGLESAGGRLMFMQSSGGLTDARLFQGKDAILSGPAGGVVGMVETAAEEGWDRLIGFDMGGTSTDVSHYAGHYERTLETEVAGVRLRAPMMRIHTVAAGGGSVLHFDGRRYRVGPDSAGADPGPAGYRKGGPLTVTDCNLMLGRIQPEFFPRVFGEGGDLPLDVEGVRGGFARLAAEITAATGDTRSPEAVAEGFLAVAVENMAGAIKRISVQRGYDVSGYTLCCFGGAGGQHACRVADALGMKRILLHPLAGVLSAFGMGLADVRAVRERTVEAPLDEGPAAAEVGRQLAQLKRSALEEMAAQGVAASRTELIETLHLPYRGTDTALPVRVAPAGAALERFEAAHRQRFGFAYPGRPVVVEAVQVEAVGRTARPRPARRTPVPGRPAAATRALFLDGRYREVPFVRREELETDAAMTGPLVIVETTGTLVVEPGWRARVNGRDNIVLERYLELPGRVSLGTRADPVMLEIFNNLFMSIAEQMGAVLENTASSVNIKERLDFSCALFDGEGDLIANAPHMPVHLGSMSESIKAVIRVHGGRMKRGDAYALNAPYNGGTHLPDVTVIKPVFDPQGREVLFYVGARGHHADIGGITPGSMPPDSRSVEEEGVLLDNVPLVEAGRLRERELRELLAAGPWPARSIETNLADLRAQLAACEKGMVELLAMVRQFGLDVVQAYMRHVQENAEASVRRVLGRLGNGRFVCHMDDGSVVEVAVRVDPRRRRARIDFTGTSPQQPGNYNAPAAVCRAAVLYVFRCLVKEDIPLNQGCFKPLDLVIPRGSMINPRYPAAVVAGNVETSQAIVDALLGALGVCAASQGTMNNFTWGNGAFQYYETLCGGSGASPGGPGTDAVHTHMTNSRLTDPEVLEWRFPVRLESFAIRRGSGGRGIHRGGDGTVRRIRFLEPVTASILAGRRRVPPYGLAGGEPGRVGRNYVERADGRVEELGWQGSVELGAGDLFVIETPGGGGWGSPAKG